MAQQESRLIISIDSRNAEAQAKSLDKELNNITNSGNRADKQVGVLSTSLKSLAGYMAGVVTVGTAINKMDAYANMQNRLRLVTQNQQELNKATSDTFAIAQKAYQSWDSVVQVYQRFSDNAKTLNINMEQTAKLTETVSKAVAISGASTQAAEAALTQFGQALASGTLRGEELNSVMEQTPALAKAIAQGMGITVGQLRTVAAEGKITSEVLVKALGKAAENVDEQFSKMQMTIGQSLTLLDNELTKFAENAGGASAVISGSIKLISENLELISSAAIVAGIGYLTTAIVTKTAAVTADVVAMTAQRAATTAQLAKEVELATTVANDARAHLALVQATNASAQAKYGATAASIRYKQATDAVTAAVLQQATAEKAAQAASITTARVGAGALAVLGGPVGIGITVASIAAGYLLMSNNASKANEKLKEQAQVANKTAEELKALEGAQRASARKDLKESFEAENEKLKLLNTEIGNYIAKLYSRNTADAETAKILREVRAGTMSYDDAIKKLNKSHADSPDIISKMSKAIDKYKESAAEAQKNADKQKVLGIEVRLVGNESQNAALKQNALANAMDSSANSAANLAAKLEGVTKNLQNEVFNTKLQAAFEGQGKSAKSASRWVETYIQNAKNGYKGVTVEQKKYLDQLDAEDKKQEARLNAQKAVAQASKDAISQAKKDAKELDRIREEQYNLRESIAYRDADKIRKIETDLSRDIADIRKANFATPEQTAGFIQNAKNRAELEKQLYVAQLTEEVSAWRLTEERKLELRKTINDLMIRLNGDMNDNFKEQALESSEDQYQEELKNIQLAKEQRIFAAQESTMHEVDAMRERYRLEMLEVEKIRDAKEKAAIAEAKNRNYINLGVGAGGDMLKSTNRRDENYGLSQTDILNQDFIKQNEEMNLRYLQQQEAARMNAEMMLQIERDYLEAKGTLNAEYSEKMVIAREEDHINQLEYYGNMLSITQSTFGNMTSLVKDAQGENSSAYKAMFVAQQAMAVASALVSTHLAAAQVMADPTALTMAQKTAYSSLILGMGYANVGMILGQTIAGFANGGYTGDGGKYDVAGLVHRGEVVWSQEDVKRAGGVNNVELMRKGASSNSSGVSVNIENYGTSKDFEVQQIDEDTVRIIARDTITAELNNPNSDTSKSLKRNFNTTNKR
jgi:tape measure domain-containing protein